VPRNPGILAPFPEGGGRFATTRWSLVLAAGGTDSVEVRPALGQLIERYWYPLYVFVRRKGHGSEEAFDLTQEFLSRLLDTNFLISADREKGKFRTFLLTALERFLVDEWRRGTRQRRGGGRAMLSLSVVDAEERYVHEPADTRTPELIYERRWALTLLEQTLARLRQECTSTGKEELFKAVEPVLAADDAARPYSEIAAGLSMSEGALKTAIHRLRRRFAAILRAEIAETVSDPRDVDEEIQHLFSSLQ